MDEVSVLGAVVAVTWASLGLPSHPPFLLKPRPLGSERASWPCPMGPWFPCPQGWFSSWAALGRPVNLKKLHKKKI